MSLLREATGGGSATQVEERSSAEPAGAPAVTPELGYDGEIQAEALRVEALMTNIRAQRDEIDQLGIDPQGEIDLSGMDPGEATMREAVMHQVTMHQQRLDIGVGELVMTYGVNPEDIPEDSLKYNG